MRESFQGKTVFITGTNRGIGKAILEAFAERGAKLIAHARKPSQEFENALLNLSQKYNVSITPIYFDLTDTENLKNEVKKIIQEKAIDVLVNNAGVAHVGLLQMTPIAKIKEDFEINLFSWMQLTQLVLKNMVKKRYGTIINISSLSGIMLKPGNSSYGVSKAAVIAWTKTIASEVSPFGIRVNAIAPGVVETDMALYLQQNSKGGKMVNSSMMRSAQPKEIANVACFLASDMASYINGAILNVDGGIL